MNKTLIESFVIVSRCLSITYITLSARSHHLGDSEKKIGRTSNKRSEEQAKSVRKNA
jgi:hypothetical protein